MTPAPGWGTTGPRPEPWRSGRWALARSGDELADIAFDDRAVLRSVRAVVRDRDWRTVPPVVESVEASDGALRVAVRFVGLGADLRGDLLVRADGDRLTVLMTLRSATEFVRNRIGLVVLHPADVAGAPFAIRHTDGSTTTTRFPRSIAPHQPATDVRALEWDHHGVHADLTFGGDVFEMEDQRNWTDASFKTYSTPLRDPFPVRVRAGDEITQEIALVCTTSGEDARSADPPTIALVRRGAPLPEFVLGATTEAGPLPPADSATLLVELDAGDPAWRIALARAADELGDGALDVRIVADRQQQVREVIDALTLFDGGPVRAARVGVFSRHDHITEAATWRALRDRVEAVQLQVELVGGTRAHFTELNRRHADLPGDLPALTFSSTPQMHAVEARQVVESIAVQRLTAVDAVRIAGGRPVHIGPVTLRPRFNAVATTSGDRLAGTEPGYAALDVGATDPRQSSAALAAWTVASAAAFAIPGVASVCWFEASGPRGLVLDGSDLPVRAAALEMFRLSGAEAVDATGGPDGVHVLAGVVGGETIALVANLRAEPITIALHLGGDARTVSVPPLEHRRVEWATTG